MSRFGYSDSIDSWEFIRWRGAVASAIRGKRGQRLLRDLVAALDAMPEKRLISDALVYDGDYCALGAVGTARNIRMDHLDPDEVSEVAEALDIAEALAAEIAFLNDYEPPWWRERENPEKRWARMRAWAEKHLAA